jgi:hypothetical protein
MLAKQWSSALRVDYVTLLDRLLRRPLVEASAVRVNGSPIALGSPWADRSTLVAATFTDLFGTDFVPVTRQTGMGLGVLAKGRHLLTQTVAGFPIVAYRDTARMERQPLICRQPEAGRPRSTTILWAMDAEYWYGRVWYLVTQRGGEGDRPMRVKWVPEWYAEVDIDGNLVRAFDKPVDPANVIRVDGPHEGILNFGADKIREALAIEAAAANASNNPVPSVDLHQTGGDPLNDDQIDALTARWVAARAKKGGGVAYSNQSIKAEVLGQPVEQLLIAARQQSDLDLARLAGLPAWGADVSVEGANLTYSNSPSRARELIDFYTAGYMQAWTDRFSLDDILPSGQWCRFDTTAILQGNFAERMTGYKAAIEAGIYTADECKLIEAGVALEGKP